MELVVPRCTWSGGNEERGKDDLRMQKIGWEPSLVDQEGRKPRPHIPKVRLLLSLGETGCKLRDAMMEQKKILCI